MRPYAAMRKLLVLVAAVASTGGIAQAAAFPTNDAWPDRDNSYFATPSGRIVCGYFSFRGHVVDCTNYAAGRNTAGQIGQRGWQVRSRGRASAKVVLGNAPTQALPRARYGVTYRYHGIKCRVHRLRGITCTNRSGHGFRLSVERQRVF